MNKILVLGDIHGRTIWKDIVNKEDPDLTIFLGDYCTTHDNISSEDQISNLEEILQYKKDNNVILLRGNHDGQMLKYYWAQCSGYDPVVSEYMYSIKDEFLNLTQWIYIINESLVCSHAGLTNYFIDKCYKSIERITGENNPTLDQINLLQPSELFGFTPDNLYDRCGNSRTQPCTWIRPHTLIDDLPPFSQIIGHTPVSSISGISVSDSSKVWLCDALGIKQYLTIIDSKININIL